MNSKYGRGKNVDLPGLDFLKVARGNFRALGQCILGQTLTNPLPAHIRAKDLDPLPFFPGNRHDILHRFSLSEMNDTYIVKQFLIILDGTNVRVKKVTG